ncbi:hypothetical protein MHH60_29905 [Paenibacillus sp. FSL H7-0716]|uniref:Lipoprotein n=1 Tax=Paenibacillus odorifer TaxID=189426 RepID=A0AB36J3L1_9BACL|nr:hypothetical protein [Paenibacillus odorifer]OME11084.1 hypothetical protein BSK47_29700 [Paenibacillus odorifer]
MKKVWSGLFIVCLVLVFAGCSSSKEDDNLTMDKFIEAFNNSGEDINHDVDSGVEKGIKKEKKPKYEMIDAKDGVIFNIANNTVKIYEYESNSKAKKAVEKYASIMGDWPVKGNFVLETNNQKAKEIFNSVK